jgi:N-acylmannosamine kinase
MSKVIAFDVGGTNSRVALIEDGNIIARDEAATPSKDGPQVLVERLTDLFHPYAAIDAPIGVAITGHIVDGRVTAHNPNLLPGWQDFPLRAALGKAFGKTVQVVNDARAAAWGEYLHGSGHGCDEFLFVTVSTGVGAGLVLNRRLHLARNGFDAELGEMKTADGVTLEELASGSALSRSAALHAYGDAKSLCDAADHGDVRAEALLQHGITEVAKKLADLAVMLGIQRVAIGGGLGLRPGYLERLQRTMMTYPLIYRYEVVRAELGHDAGLYGVAALAQSEP